MLLKVRIFILHSTWDSCYIMLFTEQCSANILISKLYSLKLWFSMFGLIEVGCCPNITCLLRIRDCNPKRALHCTEYALIAACVALCRLCTPAFHNADILQVVLHCATWQLQNCIAFYCTYIHYIVHSVARAIGSMSTQETYNITSTECASCKLGLLWRIFLHIFCKQSNSIFCHFVQDWL